MKLTEHFSLEEFTRSDTATRYHIDNTPNAQQIENLKQLCIHVLEPLRAHAGQPIIIGSGFRSPALNSHPKVGGVPRSQHQTGEACDIHIPDEATGKEWFLWAVDNLQYDQIIWEKATPESKRHWIHVSFCLGNCRQSVLRNLIKHP